MEVTPGRPCKGVISPVVGVVLAATGFYIVFTLFALALHHWDPLWFVWIGERFANLDSSGSTGYDGQFIYYLARDGIGALVHLDTPVYRLQRILLPVLLRIMTFGTPALIPWALIIVNLAAGEAVLWLRGRRAWAALLLALAVLGKEIALLFIAGAVCAALVCREWKQLIWPILAMFPWVAWELALYLRFGVLAAISGPALDWLPLAGILPHLSLETGRLSALFLAGLPALVLFGMSLVLL